MCAADDALGNRHGLTWEDVKQYDQSSEAEIGRRDLNFAQINWLWALVVAECTPHRRAECVAYVKTGTMQVPAALFGNT
jgi:hypothetical protein